MCECVKFIITMISCDLQWKRTYCYFSILIRIFFSVVIELSESQKNKCGGRDINLIMILPLIIAHAYAAHNRFCDYKFTLTHLPSFSEVVLQMSEDNSMDNLALFVFDCVLPFEPSKWVKEKLSKPLKISMCATWIHHITYAFLCCTTLFYKRL